MQLSQRRGRAQHTCIGRKTSASRRSRSRRSCALPEVGERDAGRRGATLPGVLWPSQRGIECACAAAVRRSEDREGSHQDEEEEER